MQRFQYHHVTLWNNFTKIKKKHTIAFDSGFKSIVGWVKTQNKDSLKIAVDRVIPHYKSRKWQSEAWSYLSGLHNLVTNKCLTGVYYEEPVEGSEGLNRELACIRDKQVNTIIAFKDGYLKSALEQGLVPNFHPDPIYAEDGYAVFKAIEL